jgi:hypothetical protein
MPTPTLLDFLERKTERLYSIIRHLLNRTYEGLNQWTKELLRFLGYLLSTSLIAFWTVLGILIYLLVPAGIGSLGHELWTLGGDRKSSCFAEPDC